MPRKSSSQQRRREDTGRVSSGRSGASVRGESSSTAGRRGFASMSPGQRREIAARGGRASHGGRGRDYRSERSPADRGDYAERPRGGSRREFESGASDRSRPSSFASGRHDRGGRDWDRRQDFRGGGRPDYAGDRGPAPRGYGSHERDYGFQGRRDRPESWSREEDDYRYGGSGAGREQDDNRGYRAGDRWSDSRSEEGYGRGRFSEGRRSDYEDFDDDQDYSSRGRRQDDDEDDFDYEARGRGGRSDFQPEGDDSRGGSRQFGGQWQDQDRRRLGGRSGRSSRRNDW